MKPLAVDLFCGLGGWTDGLLAENYEVIGFDIERHVYGEHRYPAQLVLQDVLTLHGRQFKDAALIVASPPCQFFSYTAMPWSRAKVLVAEVRADPVRLEKELALFRACFRIQREACEAAGRHIPLVVENVRGAIPWVGRSRWNYGSFHLWGDVPALMPMTTRKGMKGSVGTINGSGKFREQSSWDRVAKNPSFRFDGSGRSFQSGGVDDHIKGRGGAWFKTADTADGKYGAGNFRNAVDGVKHHKSGRARFSDPDTMRGSTCSTYSARKAASAAIAKIPFPLARHIARAWKPIDSRA